jgi:phospholipase/lecithinase/hemolysin
MPYRRLIAAAVLCLALPHLADAEPLAAVVVFGDSLSDTGNVSTATGGRVPPPPYSMGRFSNSTNWVDDLAPRLGVPSPAPSIRGGSDYAFGFAQTGMGTSSPASVPGLTVPNIGTQVSSFLGTNTPTSGQLFALWGGANDFFNGQTNPAVPAQNIANAVNALARAGATNFLVLNLPALGETPFGSTLPSAQRQALDALSAGFNTALAGDLRGVAAANPGVTIHTVDVAGLFAQVQASPSAFGFTDVKDSALLTGHGGDPAGFLFWDSVHPTAQGYALVAEAAVQALPEPGALTLAGLGLAALALRRLRRSPRLA